LDWIYGLFAKLYISKTQTVQVLTKIYSCKRKIDQFYIKIKETFIILESIQSQIWKIKKIVFIYSGLFGNYQSYNCGRQGKCNKQMNSHQNTFGTFGLFYSLKGIHLNY
jgi:hypothetical protein